MTYYNAIENLVKKVHEKIYFPINIVISSFSANHIDEEFEYAERDINDILNDIIPNEDNISLIWINNEHQICSMSQRVFNKFSSEPNNISLETHLKHFKYIASTKDEKYKIYVQPLSESITSRQNGFLVEHDFIHVDNKYEFKKVVLPSFADFRYKNLYNYTDQEAFINAVLIEFIIRNATLNNLLPSSFNSELEPLELESEEAFEIRVQVDFLNQEKDLDAILIKNYGLNYYEITTLETPSYLYQENSSQTNISVLIKEQESPIKNIQLNLELSEEELCTFVKKMKEQYTNKKSETLDIRNRLNADFVHQASNIINKFPKKSFKKQQDSIIKALFVFDFIQAKKLEIDYLNHQIETDYAIKKQEIDTEYTQILEQKHNEKNRTQNHKDRGTCLENEIRALSKKKEREIKNLEKELTKDKAAYPKINTKYETSIFHTLKHLLDEAPNQLKKIYAHIQKFLTEQRT